MTAGRTAARFELHRDHDVSGVSGEGIVADGIVFPDGVVAFHWRGDWPASVVFHERGIDAVDRVHGHGGSTRIVWLDDAPCTCPDDAGRHLPGCPRHHWLHGSRAGMAPPVAEAPSDAPPAYVDSMRAGAQPVPGVYRPDQGEETSALREMAGRLEYVAMRNPQPGDSKMIASEVAYLARIVEATIGDGR